MTSPDQPPANTPSSLRERAERVASDAALKASEMSASDIEKLVHELQVHQIELEMQNEELRASREELAQSRDRYLSLFEFAPIGYVSLDDDTTICEVNQLAERLLGLNRKALVGKKFHSFVVPESLHAFHHHRRSAGTAGQPTQGCEVGLVRGDGSAFEAQLETVLTLSASGSPLLYRCAISDITARKNAERTLRLQSEELLCRNQELDKFNRAMVGREMFIIELKKQVNALSSRLGLEPPFPLAFLDPAEGSTDSLNGLG